MNVASLQKNGPAYLDDGRAVSETSLEQDVGAREEAFFQADNDLCGDKDKKKELAMDVLRGNCHNARIVFP